MNKKDLSNLSNIYLEKVLLEININPESDFGDLEGSKFGRYKGRHFKKHPIPQSRKDYTPSSEREEDLFGGSEYPEIYGNEEPEEDILEVPNKIEISKLSRDQRSEMISNMSILRSEIDDLANESEQIKALSDNRKLLDKVVEDLVLGFAKGRISLYHVAEDGDPIFSTSDPIFATEGKHIKVSLPYGVKTNPEEVVYSQVNL